MSNMADGTKTPRKRKTLEERLEEAQKKEAQAKALVQRTKAQLSSKRRKEDTRRKIVIGGMVIAHMSHDPGFAAQIEKLMSEQITRPEDRKLFDNL